MKRDALTPWLIGLMVLGVLANATLSFAYVQYMRKLRSLQVEVANANRDWTRFQQLAGEAVEYSNRNKKMDQILQEAGIAKTRSAADRAIAPAAAK